jgi:SAM-dependent methyltransferase
MNRTHLGPAVMTARGYTFRLDDAEVARFRTMAVNAERHEGGLWERAGIASGATVLDLGCGPGALLPLLAERVGPRGTIIAVDADPLACATARLVAADLDASTHVVQADAADTGLAPSIAEVVMARNLLVHNGRRAADLLAHAATLVREGGHLISTEPDVAGIDFGEAHAEHAFEQRWVAMMREDGNDPALGGGDRLPKLLERNGWHVLSTLAWTDDLLIDKSPAWAAAEAVVNRAFATPREVSTWQEALERRRAVGPLACSLTMTTVLAEPSRTGR